MGRGKLGEGFRLAPEFWRPRDDLELTELSIFRGSHRFPTLQEPKNDLVSCPTSGSYMVLVSIEVHSSFPGLSEQPRENRPYALCVVDVVCLASRVFESVRCWRARRGVFVLCCRRVIACVAWARVWKLVARFIRLLGLLLQLVLVELPLDAAVRADGRVHDEVPDHLRKEKGTEKNKQS